MRILATSDDVDSLLGTIRLREPLAALVAQHGGSLRLRSFHECRRADLEAAEVVIVQRGTTQRACLLAERALRCGAALIYEIDDLLTEIAPHISNHAVMLARRPWVLRGLAAADLVTASTERLRREIAPLAHASMVVPNHAWAGAELPPARHEPGSPVHLLLVSSEHLLDSPLIDALRPLLGPAVRLVAIGPPARALAATGLPLEAHAAMPRAEFIAFVRSLVNPVAVIPLEATRFAACKSAIKWFDYAELGIPTLASAVPPYVDVIEPGRTGALVADDASAWRQALRLAIDDADWRRRIATEARAQVRARHGQRETVAAWLAALQLARERRRGRELPQPGAWQALRLWAGDWAFDCGVGLRAWNRRRLARRGGG